MEMRKDVQYVGKQLLWSMTTDNDKETESHIAELGEMRDQVAQLALANSNVEALELFNNEYNDATLALQDVLIEIDNFADNIAEESYNSSNRLGTIATIFMVAMGVLCTLFCTYIGILITRTIKKPVEELEKAAEKLSNGKLDAKIVYESKDELGSLANSFRTAFSFMEEVIKDTSYMLGELAAGNFRVETNNAAVYKGDFAGVLSSTMALEDHLDNTLKQINEGSNQVAIGANQMAENAQSLAEGATEQAGAIEELTATVENVNSMAKESATTARAAAEETEQAAKDAEAGQKSMQEVFL